MEVKKMKAERVVKFRNLRNFVGCEILQISKIRNPASFLE